MRHSIVVLPGGRWFFARTMRVALVDDKDIDGVVIDAESEDEIVKCLPLADDKLQFPVPLLDVIDGYGAWEDDLGRVNVYNGLVDGDGLSPGENGSAHPAPAAGADLTGLPTEVRDVVTTARLWLEWISGEDVALWAPEPAALANALWRLDGNPQLPDLEKEYANG